MTANYYLLDQGSACWACKNPVPCHMWMNFKLSLLLTAWLQQVTLNKLIPLSVPLSLGARRGSQVCLQWVRKISWNPYFTAEYMTAVHTHTFNPSVLSSGSHPLPMRKPTRPSGTETGWMPSWTGWPACCRSPRMSSPSWTSCLCCALQCPTSASRVSSKVKVKRWHLRRQVEGLGSLVYACLSLSLQGLAE